MTKGIERLQNVPTEQLLQVLQNNDSSESEKNSAFYSIVIRFREDLLQKCEIICKQYGYDVNTAEQIAETTFIKYLKKGGFELEYSNTGSLDNRFKRYLYKIAKNLLIDIHRKKQREEANPYNGTEGIVRELPHISLELLETLSIQNRTMYEVVQSFPKSHQMIYLTYILHQKPGFNLPLHLREALRKELGGIKQSTVAGYFKKVKDKIDYTLELKRGLK